MNNYIRIITCILFTISTSSAFACDFHGLKVAPENRCSSYHSQDYRYPPSVEDQIVERQGGIYSPYTGTEFSSTRETDIEHIVARSEAHDSGLCSRTRDVRLAFSRDLDNLTLAAPYLNRWEKRSKDASEWMPDLNQCWFARAIINIKVKYDLTIDEEERDALEIALSTCPT